MTIVPNWRISVEKIPYPFEENDAFRQFSNAAFRAGRSAKLSDGEFELAVGPLYEAYDTFLHGTNKGDDTKTFRHWRNRFFDVDLWKKPRDPFLSQEALGSAASNYLRGTLRVPQFDRALIDALIAQEVFAFIDNSAGYRATLRQIGLWIVPFGAFLGWQVLFSEIVWDRVWMTLGVLVFVLLIAWNWPKKGPGSIYRSMRAAYYPMTGSVISVPELRAAVRRSAESGVVWPPELWPLLDDVERRTPIL